MSQASMVSQAITGVAPPELSEVTNMVIWPSVAKFGIAQTLGRLFRIRVGIGNVLTIGNMIALASIPIGLAMYALKINPGFGIPPIASWMPKFLWIWNPLCVCYRLTNRRVVIEHGFSGQDVLSVSLDRFDSIEVSIGSGQEWYKAGDLIFTNGGIETFRLNGVPRPETFRQTCLKSRQSFVGVQKALEREAAMSA
jgi:hypothetical protein